MKEINVDENNSKYKSDKGILYEKDDNGNLITLIQYPSKSTAYSEKKYYLQETITTIKSYAFDSVEEIETVILPVKIEKIESK